MLGKKERRHLDGNAERRHLDGNAERASRERRVRINECSMISKIC